MKTSGQQTTSSRSRLRLGSEGAFVLENAGGETVRTFRWEASSIIVVYRLDNRRIETHSSVSQLEKEGVKFDILAETTHDSLKMNPVSIGNRGVLRWTNEINGFSPTHELATEATMKSSEAIGWSAALQAFVAGLFIIAGLFSGSTVREASQVTVTVLPDEVVEKMLESSRTPEVNPPARVQRQARRNQVVAPRSRNSRNSNRVVQPTHRGATRRGAKVATNNRTRGGGHKGQGRRGYGTNEPNMNQIGALSVLNNAPRVKGGNGGSGGLNLQAVGTEPGSGAGGKGHGGFGSNGGGGRGRGGLGRGQGSGLANSMHGKGLIAAPFGDGSPAPGSGGYGTRGKAGGGAQGAGYGTETIVGSWKGTGPRGNGPAGSGVGNGDPNGSPWGASDGDGNTMITGGLDEDQIDQVIRRNIGQIRYCYELGLQKEPHLSGRVTVRFQIGGNGRVRTAGVRASTVRSSQVESCIVSKLKNWTFPKPEGGVTVGVVYPFNLNRTVGMR